jgi:hypothetical protein
VIHSPMQEMSVKAGPAGPVQYQNTFYPGTSSLSEAQAVHVGPLTEVRDTRFTVPAERTFTVRGKVLPLAAPPPKGSVEVECTSPNDIGYNFGKTRYAVVEPRWFFQDSGPATRRLHARRHNSGRRTRPRICIRPHFGC